MTPTSGPVYRAHHGGGVGTGADTVTVLTVYLVLLLVVPAPMVITALGQVGGPATLVALGCFLWWCWWTVGRHEALRLPSAPVRNAALVYLLVVLIAYAHSAVLPLPGDERSPADSELLRAMGFAGLIALMCDGIGTRGRLLVLVRRLAIAVGLLSVLALVQTATGQIFVDRLTVPGLSPSLAENLQVRGALVRPSGTSTHPIEFAAVLAMGLPLSLVAASDGTLRRRWPYVLSAGLVALVLLLTGSRTAVVCGGVAFLGMLPSWSNRMKVVATGAVATLLALVFVAVPGAVGTLRGLFQQAPNDPSIASRTNSYAVVLEFWQQHLWLGRGMGTFLPKYWILDNQYLQVLMGAGLLGLLALLWLIGSAVWSVTRAARRAVSERDRELAVMVRASALAGAAALALFDMFSFAQAAGMFAIVLGLCGAVARVVAVERPVTASRRNGVVHASP